MRTRITPPAALLLSTALVLTGCGDGDDGPAEAATETAAAAGTDDSPADPVADPAGMQEADEASPAEPDAPEPFDPDTEIHPADIEVQEWGVGEVERPWELLLLPDDFVLPATARLVTWAPPEAPFDGGQHGISGSGAFRLYEADPDDVAGFFTSRLPDQGWDLEDEVQHDDGGWMQTWVTVLPFDGWPEDWMADERGVEVEARFTYLLPEGADQHTMQFHYRAKGVHHRWDD